MIDPVPATGAMIPTHTSMAPTHMIMTAVRVDMMTGSAISAVAMMIIIFRTIVAVHLLLLLL